MIGASYLNKLKKDRERVEIKTEREWKERQRECVYEKRERRESEKG